MTKSVVKTAALAALGVFAFSGLALSAYAAVQDDELLGGPGGPAVGKPRAQAPVRAAPPVAAPPKLTAPTMRAPLQARVDRPRYSQLPDVSSAGISDAPPLAEEEEAPLFEADRAPEDQNLAEVAPDEAPAPLEDFASENEAPHDYAEDNGADRSIEDSGEFTRLEREIERATRSGRIRQGAAVNLYAELDDIHDQREYYRRTRGVLGPQETAAVLRRLDALDARVQRAENTPRFRNRYRY